MAVRILMPALSPTMEEGKLAKWVKKEGDSVVSGEVLAEIETDKATMEFEALEDGVLGKILVEEGTEGVKVNELIAVLLEEGEGEQELQDALAQGGSLAKPSPASALSGSVSEPKQEAKSSSAPSLNSSSRSFATPLARKIAELEGLDINTIKGSGPRGRIVKLDVLKALSSKSAPASVSSASPSVAVFKEVAVGSYVEKPNSMMRKTISKRLTESKVTIPHFYMSADCNVDKLLQARANINAKSDGSYKISVNDFIIKAVGLAMQDYKEANASYQGDVTHFYNQSDISVAVAIEGGLITPIIRDVTSKGLVQISNEMKSLAKQAKEGSLQPQQYQGGGFSISNLGMFGVKEFQAIVNPPQAGILAVGASSEKAIVENGNIKVANVMTITLSADHRVLDGDVAALFLNRVKQYLEDPISMIL